MPGGTDLTRHRQFSRRLSDKILAAFEHACETDDLPVARELLVTLETLFERQATHPGQDRRRNIECLIEAHHRLFACRMAAKGRLDSTKDSASGSPHTQAHAAGQSC